MNMSKLQNLFPSKNSYAGSTVTNRAGAAAFNRSLEEQALQVLMVGNLESTFYASASELAAEAVDTLTKMATKDPEFLAKAIVYARNEGYLRVSPIVGLLILSKERPDLFKRIFRSVILQPGDLQDFMTLVRSKSVRSTGKSVRQAVGSWMNSISDYHVVKYGAPQKKAGSGSPVNLRDILRLTHPKPVDDARQALFAYIVKRIKGEKIEAKLLKGLPEKIRAYESFKGLTSTTEKAKKNEAKAIKLVSEHGLPYEVVTARLATPSAWKALAVKAPFMFLLRNCNNFEKYGVFKDKEVKSQVMSRLTDSEQIKKSKLFPFRFLAAYNAFRGDQDVREALAKAVEKSVMNIPDLGRTLVAPDESGSMDSPVSEYSDVTMKDVGNIFAAALWKKSSGGYMVPFEAVAHPVGEPGGPRVNSGDSIVTIAERLGEIRGGTSLSAPLEWAIKKDFDTGVFITDNESWADLLYRGTGVLDSIRAYRRSHPKTQFFFVQMVQESAVQAPQSEPGVHFIYGWSDNVLRFISSVTRGGLGQVDAVRATSLPEAYLRPVEPAKPVLSAKARKLAPARKPKKTAAKRKNRKG
jgi:60 kDa SS-A/Ro ribonucleoprotein